MRDKLLNLLRTFEERFPAGEGRHHAITRQHYGSDATGWEEKLCLSLVYSTPRNIDTPWIDKALENTWWRFFLDDSDLLKEPQQLANLIVASITKDCELPLPDGWSRMFHRATDACSTTMTARVAKVCNCRTYSDNWGPCSTFETGGNGRCVYCDHEKGCHETQSAN